MSQHHFKTTNPDGLLVTITLGWDRPLHRFFLVVEVEGSDGGEDEMYLYSNLNDPVTWLEGGVTLDYYGDKLIELGIQVPESMFREAARDKAENVGYRYVWHRRDGSFEEIRHG